MLTLSPPRGVDSAFSCLPKGFNNLLMNLWALDYLGNWNLMLSVVHPKEEFWPTRTFPTSAPPSSSIILLSGSSRKYPWWGYSSPRFLCPSKKSMLTFSPSWAPNFWAPFLVQNSEVFCPMRTLATSVPFSSSIGHIVTFFFGQAAGEDRVAHQLPWQIFQHVPKGESAEGGRSMGWMSHLSTTLDLPLDFLLWGEKMAKAGTCAL